MTTNLFFDELKKIINSFPKSPAAVLRSESCEFCNEVYDSKNMFYCFDSYKSTDSAYIFDSFMCATCVDCDYAVEAQLCYECVDPYKAFNCDYLEYCDNIRDSAYCYSCSNCSDIFGCVNLKNKSFCIFNRQLTEVEYKEQVKKPGQEILDLEAKVAVALEQSQREYSVEAAEWYDFDLVKDGFRGEKWDLSDTKVLAWDSQSQAAVLLNLDSKAADIVISGESLGQGKAVGLSDNRGFIVAVDKITVVDTAKQKQVAQVETDGWQRITTARGFGSNLYLLDRATDSQIWKYLGLDEGLSGKKEYLVGDVFDLSEAVDMAIDGSVWVLFSDGTIVKYTQGKKDAFQVIGLDQPLGETVKIFTSPEVEHLYLLDRANTRVVALNKSGEYASQYQWSGIAGVKDFVVSETLGKIFFLTGEKVFTIDLK